ncbi:insecticidal delta-endotoxin Cry8Ea1 family protein [Bacillus mycoides]|uniref:insecticidal delta-endotoxin Cry8Ea1 family protein n=1 Tax=Bacillus mycoides TaxID=1405 RepID=UPI0002798BFB|nr:insecticidal delta-endotoxin Cry8Ea1 family protein [Bacillus mycoides]EJR93120.1 hypothetical protein IKM_06016 [Bacillus mycoides]
MYQANVRNAIKAAEIEGIKKVREKYPAMKVSDFLNRNIAISNAELQATLELLNGHPYTCILGTNMVEDKHPLQQASSSDLRNMNLSNWQDLCDNVNPQKPIDIDPEIATAASLGIISFLLSISNPAAAAAVGIASIILPILWPTATQDANAVWKSMMANAEELVEERIEEQVKNNAISALNGLKNAMGRYTAAIDRLKRDPNNPLEQEAVRTAYRGMDQLFRFSIEANFKVSPYEVQLLPNYAEVTNLHLLFMRDAVNFGHEWGFTQAQIDSEYRFLTTKMEEYTNHCVNYFNIGLQRLASTTSPNYKPANMWDCTKYPWVAYNQSDWAGRDPSRNCNTTLLTSTCDEQTNKYHLEEKPRGMGAFRDPKGEYQGLENWNLYNDFRRDMTIMVLDIVSVWPMYDPKQYPMGIKSELTRTLYTPIRGTTYRSDGNQNTINVIENRMIQPPGLFTWLDRFSFQQINIPGGWVWTAGDLLTGGSQYRKYTLGNSFEKQFGQTGTLPIRTVDLPPNSPITKVITRQWFEPREIALYKGNTHIFTLGTIKEQYPFFTETCSGYPKTCIYDPARRENQVPKAVDPNNPNAPMSQWKDSHRLSYFKYEPIRSDSPFGYQAEGQIGAVAFGWTHMLVNPNNTIATDQITLIPAVKAYSTEGIVIKGPGSTGGDLVQLSVPNILDLKVTIPASNILGYRIRIRYASNLPTRIGVSFQAEFETTEAAYNLPATYSGGNLTYNTFGYQNTLFFSQQTDAQEAFLQIQNVQGGNLIIDKVEFIPIEGSLEAYQADQNLEKARKAVNALFTNDAKNGLRLHVTDYLVDQAAKLVECMSDEIYPQEKMCLLDQVKVAKRLSQARNLLHHGDFESPDWSGENGWKTSDNVSVTSGNPIFKGRYLHMPGAGNPQFSDTVFPTYVYQRIDESKLKPYTRYMVRGFVGNSKDLEVFITRYDKEVIKIMHVPNDITPTNPCDGAYQLGERPMLTNHTIPQDIPCDPCDAGTVMKVQQTLVKCEDPHAFSFHIDTGELDMDRNLGIWVGFKIGTTDGKATLDNLEVIEANPLTGEALARVKKREHKWKQKWMEKRMKIEKAVQTARGAIQALFTDANQNRLKPDITLNHILHAEKFTQKIPYVYNQFLLGALPPVPGKTNDIFQQLSGVVAIARLLYGQRNVLRNGDFMAGLSNWRGAEGAVVQQIGNASVLTISDWSANLSQDVPVNPEHGYILRVTAKKEGSGEGYVKISDGTDDNTETLKFTTGEEMTRMAQSDMRSPMQERYNERNMANPPSEAYGTNGYASHTMTNDSSASYGTNAYPGNNNMNYQSESFGITPYGDENTMTDYPSNNYEMNAYPSSANMTNNGVGCSCGCGTNAYAGENMMRNDSSNHNGSGYGCGCRTHPNNKTDSYPMTAQDSSLSGYVTKMVEIFPEMNRVCIEIGETSGTFNVESIELIRMDCE